ncbi:hypothetical protein DACRYDRAFT_119560 [Dacryopinax primogenitus]|uniref:Uncharacterized protein n=1 Tax=Dacryopinax primogenitus (strain DJM 731) TaxID=1858805 RepID=M5FUW0_DACPD|nr:uncharacterized protein DACRYDRAFT_119560 [Dacryopinax primogenitus]EJT97066.1 hypothetical protein DACRYDRAFT_119560 [Dacryopinax primogenitus]
MPTVDVLNAGLYLVLCWRGDRPEDGYHWYLYDFDGERQNNGFHAVGRAGRWMYERNIGWTPARFAFALTAVRVGRYMNPEVLEKIIKPIMVQDPPAPLPEGFTCRIFIRLALQLLADTHDADGHPWITYDDLDLVEEEAQAHAAEHMASVRSEGVRGGVHVSTHCH